jgi:2'-5' RNA ligase
MLTARQRSHLDRWGYPYVMEDFHFHMTLTGRLGDVKREAIRTILQERFALLEITTLSIDGIALFRQDDADSRFRIVSHCALERIQD